MVPLSATSWLLEWIKESEFGEFLPWKYATVATVRRPSLSWCCSLFCSKSWSGTNPTSGNQQFPASCVRMLGMAGYFTRCLVVYSVIVIIPRSQIGSLYQKEKHFKKKILAVFFDHLSILKIIWLFTQKGTTTITSTSLLTLCFRANTGHKTFSRELSLEPASHSSGTKTLYNTAEPEEVTWAGCRGPGLSGPPSCSVRTCSPDSQPLNRK